MASYIVEKDRLSGEYADVFSRVESYAMLENINADKQEEMLSNLVDSLYTAQTENKPAARIVGADVEKFCKEYFQEQIGWKGRLREIPALFYRLAWVVLVISLLELFFSESSDGFLARRADVSYVFFGIILGAVFICITIFIARVLLFKWKRVHSTLQSVLLLVVDFVIIFVGTMFLPIEDYLSIPLAPAVIIAAVYVIVYKAVQFTCRYRKTGSVRNPLKDSSVSSVYRDTLDMEMQKGFAKNFQKKNEKLRKKGKEELTRVQFCHNMRKAYRRANLALKISYPVIWIAVAAYVAISNYIEGVELWDTVLFAVIEAVALLLLYLVFHYSHKAFERIDQFEAAELRMEDERNEDI